MLTRRDIRIKVMQTLYSIDSLGGEVKPGRPEQTLLSLVDETRKLWVYLVLYISDIARYAEKLAARNARKYLPTERDLSINIKLTGNTKVWKLLENNTFKTALTKFKIQYLIDKSLVKNSFANLAETEIYKSYLSKPSRNDREEYEILESIFENQILNQEDFINEIEGRFIHWQDDMDSVTGLVREALSKPSGTNFMKPVGREKMDFAKGLLATVLEKDDYCLELIKPKLQNWEADRIAVIDMILLKMGVCEILYFDTIPAKVTLNEYIEIAKSYSTERSGNFVNGILDGIYKDLSEQNRVHKKSFIKGDKTS